MRTLRDDLTLLSATVVLLFVSTSVVAQTQHTADLQISVIPEVTTLALDESLSCLIKLKNIGSSPVLIPRLNDLTWANYIRLIVNHESGPRIVFIKTSGERPRGRATGYHDLFPGEELFFQEILNEGGIGPIGYTDTADKFTRKFFTGSFHVKAIFEVITDTLPQGADFGPQVFLGKITSTPVEVNFLPQQIQIDIHPNETPNSVNPASKGSIPVALLGSAQFNPLAGNGQALFTFGRTGDEGSFRFCNWQGQDVNKDGFIDLLCHFSANLTDLRVNDSQGTLKGQTREGIPVLGMDSVRVVPAK